MAASALLPCLRLHIRTLLRSQRRTDRPNRARSLSHTSRTDDRHIGGFILEHTEPSGEQSLTPELRLRLLTPNCRFWTERPELWPYEDPYWAIYWPGGQALARFLLDNPDVCRGKKVLDVGSGCGGSSMAAELSGASLVVANDIDPVAGVATRLNCALNHLDPLICISDNMIGLSQEDFDVILLGDMFYDEALATDIHCWLNLCINTHGTRVLIGDPGRAQFEGHEIQRHLHQLAHFLLPEAVQKENYGLTHSSVWSYEPQLMTDGWT